MKVVKLVGLLLCIVSSAHAQIAEECQGVVKAADYSEDHQRAFLQNYFATSFMLTPAAPATVRLNPGALLGAEVAYIPALSCQQRLALDGTKTENANISPVLPRLRLMAQLPDIGPLAISGGLAFLPPIPMPFGSVVHVGVELGVGYRTDFNLDFGVRGHFEMAQVRAEIATPFNSSSTSYEDVFYSATYGGEVGVSYRAPELSGVKLVPFLSGGFASSRTLFIVGDDLNLIQNDKYPWYGATAAVGLQLFALTDHLNLSVVATSAIPVFTTAKLFIGYSW